MPGTKKPRHAHRQRPMNIPVTKGLVDEFGMAMHTSLAILEHAPSMDAFDAVGRCLNVIVLALQKKKLLAHEFMPTIQSGVLAMQQIEARAVRSQLWHATALELVPVKRAVLAAEYLLSKFQVFDLYRAMQTLKVLHMQDQQLKNNNATLPNEENHDVH